MAAGRRTVVVGASYSGTELIAQLRAPADAAAQQSGFDPASVRSLLLDLAEQVMPEVGEKLGTAAMNVLRSRDIDVRLGTTLKEVHADHVVLSDDSRVDTRTVAWVTGVTAAPLIATLGLPTEKGRLKVDAIRQGKALARNVAASLGYGSAKPYRHRNMGLVVDLGPHYAVANPLNVQLSGYPAKFVTRAYHLYAMPRFVNRWAVALAYLTDVLFARTVVSMGLSSQEDAQFSAS